MKDLTGEEILDRVLCGFNKYTVGVTKNFHLVISYGTVPVYSTLELTDLSIKNMRDIAEMLLSVARILEKDIKGKI